jgi:polygalacturonase
MKNNKYLIIAIAFMLSSGTILGKSIFDSLYKLSKTNSANTIPGAYGDGIHYDTKAIQAAIDSVSNIGGGIVHFSNGKYLTGPFTIGSNVTLQIDSSATILASQNAHDYYQPGADTTKPPTSLLNFISANHAINITITGGGTIDGQGQPWWAAYNKSTGLPLRPRLIEIDHSQNILVDSVTLQNSPMFHLCPNYCTNVNVNHVVTMCEFPIVK